MTIMIIINNNRNSLYIYCDKKVNVTHNPNGKIQQTEHAPPCAGLLSGGKGSRGGRVLTFWDWKMPWWKQKQCSYLSGLKNVQKTSGQFVSLAQWFGALQNRFVQKEGIIVRNGWHIATFNLSFLIHGGICGSHSLTNNFSSNIV